MRRNLSKHQFRTYYHGTQEHNVEGIEKHGLKANLPGEAWGLNDPDDPDPGHPKGVYLSSNIEGARDYGNVVYSVELPDSADWGWTESEGHVLLHDINPVVLKRVE